MIVFPYCAIELKNSKGQRFKFNGQREKHYLGGVEEVKEICEVNLKCTSEIRHTQVMQ